MQCRAVVGLASPVKNVGKFELWTDDDSENIQVNSYFDMVVGAVDEITEDALKEHYGECDEIVPLKMPAMANRHEVGRAWHPVVRFLWTQEVAKSGAICVRRISGKTNPPDALTKPMKFDEMMSKLARVQEEEEKVEESEVRVLKRLKLKKEKRKERKRKEAAAEEVAAALEKKMREVISDVAKDLKTIRST